MAARDDPPMRSVTASPAYDALLAGLAAQRCLILDGAVGTELPDEALSAGPYDEQMWGVRALATSPADVQAVHRRYVDVGCDVITTNTWGLATAVSSGDGHWLEVARRGVQVARAAVAEGGREGRTAVAFSLNGDIDGAEGPETIRLLTRAWADEPPDLVLVETLTLVQPTLLEAVSGLLDTGIPVWMSFRRCRHGLCGVYGQHWGGPEGDAFGRAARRFEEMGLAALLINCIPPDHVDGMVSYLRDFTDLPLGVYPNLGYYTTGGWQSTAGVGGEEYAAMALRWREEGAQIIGGCCGTRPEHIAAARAVLDGTTPGRRRPDAPVATQDATAAAPIRRRGTPWADERGWTLFPLPVPDLVAEGTTATPTPASFLVWQYLFEQGVGAGRRCLDVGCGSGLQAIQLALNGASHVHAIDVDPDAIRDTLANAYRNGVADRVTAAAVDLFPWVPLERYETLVAALDQTPVDPFASAGSHRPVDYWGRSLVDHLIGLLPDALTDDGEAFLLLHSVLSQERTSDLLIQHGLVGEVVDYACLPFDPSDQVARVEGLSDAYHLRVARAEVMVGYLLRVTRA